MNVLLRKAGGGSDSYGHVWRTGKSVVEVSEEQAAVLLAIADAGFSVVDADVVDTSGDDPEHDPEHDEPVTEPAPEHDEPVTEVAPDPAEPVTEPAPEHPGRRAPRKTAKPAARQGE